MDQTAITAASGLHSRLEALDMLANNLANSTTGGYKLDREFYSLFNAAEDPAMNADPTTTKLPVIQRQWTDFSQGVLTKTGSPMDLSLSGKGFFAVNGPTGPLYTRNGSFQISSAGVLTTAEGYPVRATGGTTIQTTSSNPIRVADDGTVEQDGQQLGQLELMDFQDRSGLVKRASAYFANTSPTEKAVPATDVQVNQGKIEGSNVTAAELSVRLVSIMRQFEMLQKAVTLTSDMSKQALDTVARVQG